MKIDVILAHQGYYLPEKTIWDFSLSNGLFIEEKQVFNYSRNVTKIRAMIGFNYFLEKSQNHNSYFTVSARYRGVYRTVAYDNKSYEISPFSNKIDKPLPIDFRVGIGIQNYILKN